MKLGERAFELLTRVLSLRVIVIVAALSVVALVITLGAWVWFGVTNDQYSQLDRRLDSVSSLGDISTLLQTAQQEGADQPQPWDGQYKLLNEFLQYYATNDHCAGTDNLQRFMSTFSKCHSVRRHRESFQCTQQRHEPFAEHANDTFTGGHQGI